MKKQQLVVFALLISAGVQAYAANTAGTLPWDTAIGTLSASFTGPWAYGVSLVALVGAFATLAFSSDLSGAGRTLVYLTIAIAGLVLVTKLLTSLFGGAAATGSLASRQLLAVLALWLFALLLATVQRALLTAIRHRRQARQQRTSPSSRA